VRTLTLKPSVLYINGDQCAFHFEEPALWQRLIYDFMTILHPIPILCCRLRRSLIPCWHLSLRRSRISPFTQFVRRDGRNLLLSSLHGATADRHDSLVHRTLVLHGTLAARAGLSVLRPMIAMDLAITISAMDCTSSREACLPRVIAGHPIIVGSTRFWHMARHPC